MNYLYPPLIFFNLLSSLFSTAALSVPPPSFTPPGVVARSLQTSTHLLLFTVFICLLRAADFFLSTTLCPDAHLAVCTFIHTRPQEGVYLTTEGLASLKSPAFAYKTTTVIERAGSYISHQYRGGKKGLFGANTGPAFPPPLGPGRLPLNLRSGPWNRRNGGRGGPLG